MRLIFSIAILLPAMTSTALATEINSSSLPTRISACDFWSSETDGYGYVCSGYPRSINVVEAHYIQQLEHRVERLELRLQQLEN